MKKIMMLIAAGLFMLPVQAQLIPGAPDSNFNANGFHFWDGGKGEALGDVAVDPTGFIWSVGSEYNPDGRVLVTRLQPSGIIDPSFGTNGILTINPNANEDDFGAGILMLDDGTAVIACGGSALNTNIVFYRIMKNGSVDPNWGEGGSLVIDESSTDVFSDFILDSKGRIVMVGSAKGNSNNDLLVVRITKDGLRDSSFNQDGSLLLDIDGLVNTGQSLAENSVGGYYVLSTADNNKSYVNSFSENGNGRLDFNNKSYFAYQSGANITQMRKIQVDTAGKILLGGRIEIAGNRDAHLARFKANGNLDLSFNSTGSASFFPFAANQEDEGIMDMLQQEDGKILFISMYGTKEYVIFRVKYDGVKDPFFGNNNGFYKGSPDANVNFFNMNAMCFTKVDSQAVIVGNIYLGADDYFFYHAFYYDTEQPSSGGNTGLSTQTPSALNVFPNPASTFVNLRLPETMEANAVIMDMQGRVLSQQNTAGILDVSMLPQGVYVVRVVQNTVNYTARIQINR